MFFLFILNKILRAEMRNVLLLPIAAIQCAMLEVVRRKKVKKKIREKCLQSTSSTTTVVACKPLCYVSEFNGIGNAAASFSHCLVCEQESNILAKELNCVV